ncbi:hypothetical protein LEP48_16675 [Isoptericola sp. NEAU-Y5]|uniref:Uncharacterized protein n=1 Tax=Isoptericola luteus TaxID=2879484 RepID=A0ABS7ZKB8_9MICO|nr:hypothetical protein [Isoptericola sp. NEAU-Y5]MCA5894967.1 hypothetical protein [Isoptericola sp. NEAU-Y5]
MDVFSDAWCQRTTSAPRWRAEAPAPEASRFAEPLVEDRPAVARAACGRASVAAGTMGA